MIYEDRYKEFEQYLASGELGVEERACNWSMAIGLQEVDGLKPLEFLLEQVKHKAPEVMELKKSENISNFANLFVLVCINETFCIRRSRNFCEYGKCYNVGSVRIYGFNFTIQTYTNGNDYKIIKKA